MYVGLSLALYLLQERMVFLSSVPGRELVATPADFGWAYESVAIDTADGERLHGWYVPAANSRGTLLFFHGNAGNISHRLDSIGIFRDLGLDTLIIDYRGYGESTGRTSEAGTYRDAEAAWKFLVNTRQVPPARIVIFGRSLGGAVGAWLGARQDPAGVIIESCFTSGADLARRLYPYLPTRLITRLRYPVTDYARRLASPVLVVHSRDDEIIPYDMGRSVFEAVKARKHFVELRGGHNDGIYVSRQSYIAGLGTYIESVLGSNLGPESHSE
jgi:fermentation-respiration switch protein FrsA (DUF1100 family)